MLAGLKCPVNTAQSVLDNTVVRWTLTAWSFVKYCVVFVRFIDRKSLFVAPDGYRENVFRVAVGGIGSYNLAVNKQRAGGVEKQDAGAIFISFTGKRILNKFLEKVHIFPPTNRIWFYDVYSGGLTPLYVSNIPEL